MAILQNKFIREDGSIIGSSVIISCKYTSEVNSQTNLTVGDTTAAEVDVEIRNLAKEITAGEKLTYYQIEDGVENLIGVFYAEAPTIATKTSVRFKAYDGKAKLATDFSEWLNNHQDDFPMSLRSLVQAACEVAGVTLASDSFQFEDLSIPAFYADGVTSRQVVSWAAQIAGCFVACKTSGEIFFDWYRSTTKTIAKTQFVIDGLSKSSYTTDLIRRVQFKQSADDVGVIYPADADGNVFSISQNGVAALLDSDTLRSIAQYLYEKLKTVTYTPLTVKLPKRTANIKAGDIISVTDGNGNTVTTYVMKVYLDAGGTTISSTGDQNYADKAAVSSEKYKNIPGRVLEIEKSVDALRIQNADTAGKVAELSLDVDGLSTKVSNAEGDISTLQQTAGEVHVSASKYATLSTSYSFSHDSDGNLILTYTGDKPNYSIDDDGNLILTYTGDKPDIWADEDGYILTTEESLGTTKVLGTLSTDIDGNGTWESKFVSGGKTVSSLYFDFSNSRFVFNGHVVATSGEIGGCSILAGRLQVPAANIYGTLAVGNLPDGVATTDDIPSDAKITEITNTTISTTNVLAENLQVKAANIDGTLTADQIELNASGRNYFTNDLRLDGYQLNGVTLDLNSEECPFGFYAVGSQAENGRIRFPSGITGNGKWTLSWSMRGSQSVSNAGFTLAIHGKAWTRFTVTSDNQWVRHSLTVDISDYTPSVTNYIEFYDLNWAYFYVRNIKIEEGYKDTGWVPAPEDAETYTTIITRNTVKTTDVIAENLHVKAANVDGALTFGDDGNYYIDPSATDNYLNLPGLSITTGGATFDGTVTATSGSFGIWDIGLSNADKGFSSGYASQAYGISNNAYGAPSSFYGTDQGAAVYVSLSNFGIHLRHKNSTKCDFVSWAAVLKCAAAFCRGVITSPAEWDCSEYLSEDNGNLRYKFTASSI